MKKTILSGILITLFTMLNLVSCTNETVTSTDEISSENYKSLANKEGDNDNTELIANYKKSLQYDPTFNEYLKTFFATQITVNKNEIYRQIGQQVENDSEINKDAIADSMTSLVLFYDKNQDFDKLSDEEKSQVAKDVLNEALTNVNNALAENSTPSFEESSLEATIFNYKNDVEELNAELTTAEGKHSITWSEVGVCAIGAAADYIGNNWGLIKGLYGVLQGENLSYGTIKAAVLLFFPEAQMAATVVSLAGCLVAAYFL